MPQTRRKAQDFARAAEGVDYQEPGITPLLDLVDDLAEVGHSVPGPSPAFRQALRQHLFAVGEEIDAALAAQDSAAGDVAGLASTGRRGTRRRVPESTVAPSPAWRRRLAAAGFAVGVIAGGAAGTAMASSDALPGDLLYGVKRTVEEVQLTLAGSDTAKAQRYLEMADTRLDEVVKLVDRPSADTDPEAVAQIASTLNDLRDNAVQGSELLIAEFQETGDPKQLSTLLQFVESHQDVIDELKSAVPVELEREHEAVADLLKRIMDEVLNLDPNATADPAAEPRSEALPGQVTPSPSTVATPTTPGPDDASPSGSVAGGVALGDPDGPLGIEIGSTPGSSGSGDVDVTAPGLPLPNVEVNLLGISVHLNLGG